MRRYILNAIQDNAADGANLIWRQAYTAEGTRYCQRIKVQMHYVMPMTVHVNAAGAVGLTMTPFKYDAL